MSSLPIQLSEAQLEQLRQKADGLGITPEALVKAAVLELLTEPDDQFKNLAQDLLERNSELYRRLA